MVGRRRSGESACINRREVSRCLSGGNAVRKRSTRNPACVGSREFCTDPVPADSAK